MKKIFTLLLLALLLCSCTKTEPAAPSALPVSPAETPAEQPADNEYYKTLTSSTARPIAVMIDNDEESARPPAGIENAYMIYEITVEGAATRLMALFKDHSVAKVGPVRSSRHYFLDYVLEHDAVYVHAGQSPKAGADIQSLALDAINGITGSDGAYFHRDYTYTSSWHTLYTGTDKMWPLASKKGYGLSGGKLLYSYAEQDTDFGGDAANSILLPYANFYQLNYKYNSEKKVYERYINGTPHSTQSGEVLSAKNVIVLYMDNYDLNDGTTAGRQELDNKGSGKGYYATGGKIRPVKWSKQSRKAKTVITDETGSEITLNPGTTYVQIIPDSKAIKIN